MVAREKATSVGSSWGLSFRWVARREAWALRALSDFAERTKGIGPGRGLVPGVEASGSSPLLLRSSLDTGASSKIRWALVPLTPKEETPARRGRPLASQGSASESSSISPWPHSTLEEGAST